uniref:signal-regulatory protein beta-2-like n=1 Tax=Monopterus albus TaxID=43700 RepID=UPI0009B3A09D|nr:signal-regulatory protein beta-2-like [Monopterus albus]
MSVIFYLLLMLQVGRCRDDQKIVTKTVGVGENVILRCVRQTSGDVGRIYWVKLVAGNMPEVLGRAFNFDYDGVANVSRVATKQEPGTFVLQIAETKLSDTAFYYCLKSERFNISFLKGIFLRIKGPEPDISAVIQDFPPDSARPGDSVTLQCSVFSGSESKTCPGEHSVYWFKVGSDESHPSVIYAQGNSGDQCEKSAEAYSPQKCAYSFSRNVSSSDAGTYYCAVAACGQILFGNGTKLDIEAIVS